MEQAHAKLDSAKELIMKQNPTTENIQMHNTKEIFNQRKKTDTEMLKCEDQQSQYGEGHQEATERNEDAGIRHSRIVFEEDGEHHIGKNILAEF